MDYQLGSEQLGYHSEILEYLEQVQEEAQRQCQKSRGTISSFRLEKGVCPFPQHALQARAMSTVSSTSTALENHVAEHPRQSMRT